jgi:hypothetical protein
MAPCVIENNQWMRLKAFRLIPHAEARAIIGTSPNNRSLEHSLELCSIETYIVMLGDPCAFFPCSL